MQADQNGLHEQSGTLKKAGRNVMYIRFIV
jgi:hypothetical protein